MNQNVKTAIFSAVAVLVLILAIVMRPGSSSVDASYDVGQPFFPDFKDPLAAVTLEVIKFDEDLAAKSEFKVSQRNGAWVIPSHQNYPADAQSQMKSAAALLIGLTKLGIVTGDKAEHESYGVKDPDEVNVGTKGVGTLMRLSDKDGRVLAKLIVGKAISGQADQHYVRVPGFDRVYVSKISVDSLSTRFTDWIERDLLAVNSSDIRRVSIDNYSIDETRRTKVQGDQLVLTVEPTGDMPWNLKGLKEDEELSKEKLNTLKSAIDDLKIVDVERKPDLLSKNLRTGREFFKDLENPANQAIVQSLVAKGYFPVPVEVLGKQDITVLSNEGEVVVGLQDGVEYVLRFGEITGDDSTVEPVKIKEPATKDAAKDDAGKDEKKDAPKDEKKKKGNNRFMYIVARMNEGLVKKPELTPLPEVKPPATPEPKTDDKKDEKKEEKPDEKAKEKSADPATAPKDEKAAEKKDEKTPEKAEPAKEADPAVKPPAPAPTDEAIKKITEENQRKQKAYEDQLEAARKRVGELNARFADWYYVIPDSEFVKIRLARKDIVGPNKALLNKKAGEQFLAENKAKEGIKTTASGLQYKVIKEGTGKTPKVTDEVTVHYKGTLADGTVFDQSKEGKPAQFRVDGVIAGWTEALQMMKEGGKLQLFIPSDLAYGVKGSGDKIGPNAVLVFDVELVSVK